MVSLVAFVKTLIGAKAPTHYHAQTSKGSTCHANPVIEAIVTQTIAPGRRGQVKCQGSWWTARSVQGLTLLPGKVVYVISRQNITLYVEPAFIDSMQGR
ncbi:MAG: NfeD family protein [Lyngbya sp. HA4199-MV5]|jgi:membrane protein implicated in regulation of membrane protease activity|nr:NfeD family protein [Lyngbya sp. HA4199-MV5]